ncbi:MAG: hypothetical protein IT324_29480 [Anaerolineae bacterium]|nr:hypothetical protein [Anaerolineae bacterium]
MQAKPDFIMSLPDSSAGLSQVGGKGTSLARLAAAGLPVPPGFHVTTAAYRRFVADHGLQEQILAAVSAATPDQPTTLEEASSQIGKRFVQRAMPDDIAEAICRAYAGLGGGDMPVAVRSSATAEDLPEASFAGQQETYLNIRGEKALLEAVKRCWASLWTARAIAYRVKNNIDQDTVALAVVVQEMVNAEAAGILFTANPMNGKRDEMVINAAWGLGEAIVGGSVSPDTIIADKATGKVRTMDVAEKTVITVLTEAGTREESLNDARRRSQVLNEAQVRELVGIARRIENFYGKPQDIEWCNAGGRFYLVQSRPITTLPEEAAIIKWTRPNPKAMYARGSLAEHLPNAVSPLFATLGLRAINKATAELSDLMEMNLLAIDYQYRVVNGYVYMGFVLTAQFTWTMIKVTFKSFNLLFRKSRQRWLDARKTLAEAITNREKKDPESLSPSELLAGAYELMYRAGKYYTVIQSSTLPSASSSEIIFTSVYKMVSRKDEPKAETLLLGLDTVPLRAEKSLFDLGNWIRERPALRDFTLHASSEELVTALKADSHPDTIPIEEWDEFKSRLEKHSDEFGHTSYEFDFMNPTPAETPELILDSVKIYVEGRGNDPYARQREVAANREQAVQKIRSRFKLIPNRWFDKALKWAMDAGPAREDSLADMGMAHTTIRCMLGELGKRFVSNGALANAEDIYWLVEDEVNELAAMLERSEKLPDYSGKVPARKAEWHKQMKLVPPAMMPEKSPIAKMLPWSRQNEAGNVIKGLGASAGKVTATACVMFTPEDFNKMKPGNVLVAVITTPAWTPLFTMASAIVTDIGGPLSHSSIVAREYGIPAVLATGSATRRIQDGQTITVDGTKGEVVLETSEQNPTEPSLPPLEWVPPRPHTIAARLSFVEFVPDAVLPLFATLAVPIASQFTSKLMDVVLGTHSEAGYYFEVVNGYVYGCLDTHKVLQYLVGGIRATSKILRYGKVRWAEVRDNSRATANKWRQADLTTLPAVELVAGVCELFGLTADYFTVAQSGPIPASTMSEALFSYFYKALVKRKSDPAPSAFLIGLGNLPLEAETSLFDLAQWAQGQTDLAYYLRQTPAQSIWCALQTDPVPVPLLGEFAARFTTHLTAFGHAVYDLDFTKPVPADNPVPMLDTLKVYLTGQSRNPHVRIQAQAEQRCQAERAIIARLDPLRRRLFKKLLKSAQDCAPERENAIADLGLTYPQIRRLLRELGRRLTLGGAINQPEDIYWLEAKELDLLAAALERNDPLDSHAVSLETRKAAWRRECSVTPPPTLPEKSLLSMFMKHPKSDRDSLKGFGASAGKVTAPACVLRNPENFGLMHPGDVLVAVTTTPAWTPLFAMASAVVTDIGGPLSHSSIVAREYSIPAVMATGVATRRIHTGEIVTVDGSAGTVTLKE